MRIALASAILERPDILLLDEPTNYLDIEARTWLEGFLADFPGGLLLVSHDRYFLDVVVTAVAEIYMARVSVFTGNYSHYEEARSGSLRRSWSAGVPSRRRCPHMRPSSPSSATTPPRRAWCRAGSRRWRRSSASKSRPSSRPSISPFPRRPIRAACPVRSRAREVLRRARRLSRRGLRGLPRRQARRGRGQRRRANPRSCGSLSGREQPDDGALRWGSGVVPAFYSQENADSWTSDAPGHRGGGGSRADLARSRSCAPSWARSSSGATTCSRACPS